MTSTPRPMIESLIVLALLVGAMVMIHQLAAGACLVIVVLAVYIGLQI